MSIAHHLEGVLHGQSCRIYFVRTRNAVKLPLLLTEEFVPTIGTCFYDLWHPKWHGPHEVITWCSIPVPQLYGQPSREIFWTEVAVEVLLDNHYLHIIIVIVIATIIIIFNPTLKWLPTLNYKKMPSSKELFVHIYVPEMNRMNC